MDNIKNIREKMRIFYYSTLIPINLAEDNKSILSLPENICYASDIIAGHTPYSHVFNLPFSDDFISSKSFCYKNDFDECLINVEINKDIHLVAGPVLTEKTSEGYVNNLIRQKMLPIGLKSKLINHYENLPVIDNNRLYYCGRLLDNLFFSEMEITVRNDTDMNLPSLPDEYYANMVNNRQSLFHHTPYFLEQELVSKIKTGNLNGSIAILNEINSLKKPKLALDKSRSIKNSLICSVTFFTRAAIEGGVPPEAAFTLSDSAILEIERMNDIHKLIDYEYRVLEQYVKIVQDLSKNKYSNVIQQVLSYIYKNLTSHLTLKDISIAVYVHPNYLSTLFTKEVGINLPDYIMKTRVEESKYYIRYTNTRISDIATFYQFCNQSYYTEIFKKYVGLTPRKYREKYNNQNE